MQNTNNLISRKQAAQYLGIKEQTMAAWASNHRNDLPYIKIGSRAMYEIDDLDAFKQRNRVGD